jgi:tetratricopeptide (TPR) repeat protein
VDLEVPGSKDKVFCEKCFAVVAKSAEFCPECGAPMQAGTPANSSDSEVHAELAQANLHRMRGEYKQAEDLCLGILRRYPNNASANTLLGDIASARGELEQAAEWYELALDIVPDSKEDREKLEQVKAQIAQKQRVQAVAQVEVASGVPTKRSPIPAIAAGVVLAMVAGAAGFAAFGPKDKVAEKPKETNPLELKDPPKESPIKTPSEPEKANPAADHEALSNRIADAAQVDRAKVVAFSVDVKDKSIRIGFNKGENEDENRASVARLIHAAFAQANDAPQVHVEVMAGGKSGQSFHLSRGRYDETQTKEWKERNGESIEALVLHYLGAPAQPNNPNPTIPENPPLNGGENPPSTDPAIEPPPTEGGNQEPPPTTGGTGTE